MKLAIEDTDQLKSIPICWFKELQKIQTSQDLARNGQSSGCGSGAWLSSRPADPGLLAPSTFVKWLNVRLTIDLSCSFIYYITPFHTVPSFPHFTFIYGCSNPVAQKVSMGSGFDSQIQATSKLGALESLPTSLGLQLLNGQMMSLDPISNKGRVLCVKTVLSSVPRPPRTPACFKPWLSWNKCKYNSND